MSIKVGKNYFVGEIPAKQAREIVKRYHYSGKCVSNSSLHLGVFSLQTLQLVGALQFGPPMNGARTAVKFCDDTRMLELNRMVMADEEPRNAESQAISLCLKWVKENTDISYILSFSDGKEGNCGYIYQATNWRYIGYLLSDSFYDLDGDIVHNVTVWHRYKEKHPDRDTKTTNDILCDNFHNVSVITSKQHIYLIKLRKRVAFKHDAQPYPKKDTEVEVVRRKWIQICGLRLPRPVVVQGTDEKLHPCI